MVVMNLNPDKKRFQQSSVYAMYSKVYLVNKAFFAHYLYSTKTPSNVVTCRSVQKLEE